MARSQRFGSRLEVPIDNPTDFSLRPWWLNWRSGSPDIVTVTNPNRQFKGAVPVDAVLEIGAVPVAEYEKPIGMSDLALDSLRLVVHAEQLQTQSDQVAS